ncbi:MAG: SpoIID/LytB domain-containing protein [Clostridiaceae bacterium]|jgi:stage II sporulation protein D|nr:SpoIID/LytB domain-containing protein [Clostridiaceae bacterium]
MIKRFLKRAVVLLFTVTIIFPSSTVSIGAHNIPETVKVGLYYRDNSVNTAQSIFAVSAGAGLQIGYFSDNEFTQIYREPSSSAIYVRKDEYYYNTGSGIKEYSPSATSPSGTAYGPYHIKIGNDYPDAASAEEKAASYTKAGVQAYVSYADAWQVWTASCVNEADAQAEISKLRSALGDAGYTMIQPSSTRIVVIDASHRVLCMFDSGSAYFRIRPAQENNPPVLRIKDRLYRGALEVRRLSSSDMTVINVVTIQEYLYGNVPPEIGGKSPDEALKAQAIASKMYVINNMGKHAKTGFDLCATTSCQVYKGYSSEVASCNKVIDEVKDKIITYNGQPAAHIYYFASGGGSTEDVRNVWGSTHPYLVSVEDKYEKITNWTKTLSASDVKARLPKLGNILGISITRTADTGRVTQLAVRGASRGEPEYYSNERCRTLFGLSSQLYTITTDADVFATALSQNANAGAGNAADATIVSNAANASDATNAVNSTDASVASEETASTGENSKDAVSADANQASEQTENQAGAAKDEKAVTEPAVDKLALPASSEPIRTQLGGKSVVTASGVRTLKGSNNKITILGADGNEKKAAVLPETYTFTGKGWGHAVGMSQEGAIGMGKAGLTYDQILTHYFQGTKVE